MEVKKIKLSKIKANPSNPRTITEDKMRRLVDSLLVFPKMLELRPVVIDEKNIVLGGNMRTRALNEIKKIGRDGLPERLQQIRQFVNKPSEEQNELLTFWDSWFKELTVPVCLADSLSPDEQREFIIKDNSAYGAWDWDILANEWDSVELDDWGVDTWQMEDVDLGNEDNEPADAVEDDFDEETETITPKVKRGEIWQLGEHRLMCGDSTNPDDVAKLMNGEKADMVFTDPPYGVSIGDKNKVLNEMTGAMRLGDNIENDTEKASDLLPLLVTAMKNARESCKDDASYFVTSPQGGELFMMMMMMKDAGLPVRHVLIWVKNQPTFSLGRLDYDYQHEPIMYTWTKKHNNYRNGEFRTSIWTYDKPRANKLHPTMKPVALVSNCLNDCSLEQNIILDLFGGSGTTIIASEQLNRKCYMMELDPHYCDVIIARWEKLTGGQAVKIE